MNGVRSTSSWVFIAILIVAILPAINAMCFDPEFKVVLNDNDDTCYVIFDGKKVTAGFLTKNVKISEDRNCFDFDNSTTPFMCKCQGTICNGRAVTIARQALGLSVETPTWEKGV